MDDPKKTASSRHNWADIHMSLQRQVTAHARPAQTQTRQNLSTEKETWTQSSIPNREAICSRYLLEKGKKNQFSPMQCHWVYQPQSRAGPDYPGVVAQHKIDFIIFSCIFFFFLVLLIFLFLQSVCFDSCCFFFTLLLLLFCGFLKDK